MATRRRKTCPRCGASMTLREVTLTKGLVRSLRKLDAAGGGPIHPRKQLGLDAIAWNTFKKLKYWNFVRKARLRGYWKITPKGRAFAASSITVPLTALVLRDRTRGYTGPAVYSHEV